MRALIVYEAETTESRLLAEAIATGLGESLGAELTVAADVSQRTFCPHDLLVIGAPQRGTDIRTWLLQVRLRGAACAVFSTRTIASRRLGGSVSPGIMRALRRAGGDTDTPPVAFLTGESGRLSTGELGYATQWGRQLGGTIAPTLQTVRALAASDPRG